MQVLVNQTPHELPAGATLAEALAQAGARPPFAAALNLQFVPKTRYAQTPLRAGDQKEILAPIPGG